jgi:hypothetical protein
MHVLRFLVLTFSLMLCANAFATERKAYKHVDEKGNITYSQTPPIEAKDVKKIDISPAQSGRGGYPVTGSRDLQNQRSRSYQDEYTKAREAYQRRSEEAAQKRKESLQAECIRNRGTDCNNPETLRDMEAQRTPGGSRINPAYR